MSIRRLLMLLAGIAGIACNLGIHAQTISTYAGGGAFVNAPALSVAAPTPLGTAVAPDGTVYYVAGNSVYHLNPSAGTVTAVAGNETSGYSGDGGPATSAQLASPYGVALDAAGNLYIADTYNNVIRRVDASTGTISTVAGDDTYGYSGDGGPATSAALSRPFGVALDAAAKLYIGDAANFRVRVLSVASTTFTATPGALSFGNEVAGTTSAAMGITVENTGNVPLALTITRSGANPGQFRDGQNCGTYLAVRSSCTINVTFEPTATGLKTATVSIDGGAAGTQTVALSGTGVASYTVSPTSIPFGNVRHGTGSSSQSVTVTNTSAAALPIRNIKLSGINPAQFSQTNTCGTSVAAGTACTISVEFKPTKKTSLTATLSINAGGGAGTQTVALSGTGS